jgi:hypothetical protein
VPAPAVIPAPRAYINAVAVKGFVVELWVAKVSAGSVPFSGSVTAALATREHQKQKSRDRLTRSNCPSNFRMQRMLGGPPVILL